MMSRETYERSGKSHTRGDVIVGCDKLKDSQKELNGHVSMMLKIFKVGDRWEHSDRIRESTYVKGQSYSVPNHIIIQGPQGVEHEDGDHPTNQARGWGPRGNERAHK